MSYEEIIRDTEEMTRKMALKWDIISALLVLMMAALLVLVIRLMWQEHKEKKALRAQERAGGDEYQPTVTENVQIVNGVEFHRMGVPKALR